MIRHFLLVVLCGWVGLVHAQTRKVDLRPYRKFSVLYAPATGRALVGISDPTRQAFTFAFCRADGRTGIFDFCRVDSRLWLPETEMAITSLRRQFERNLRLAHGAAKIGLNAGLLNSVGANSMYLSLLVAAEDTGFQKAKLTVRQRQKLLGLLNPTREFPYFLTLPSLPNKVNLDVIRRAVFLSLEQISARQFPIQAPATVKSFP